MKNISTNIASNKEKAIATCTKQLKWLVILFCLVGISSTAYAQEIPNSMDRTYYGNTGNSPTPDNYEKSGDLLTRKSSKIIKNSAIEPDSLVSATEVVYLRSTSGPSWGVTTNEQSMNAVFGVGNWQDLRYETANVASVFSSSTKVVITEGGANTDYAMNTFLNNNRTAMENWVSNGGRLLLNAAPWNIYMNYGFGGVTLNFFYASSTAVAAAGQSSHPIFNSPYTPTGTGTFTGSYFSHATITCGDCTTLITGR
jgi:hypothetical protein